MIVRLVASPEPDADAAAEAAAVEIPPLPLLLPAVAERGALALEAIELRGEPTVHALLLLQRHLPRQLALKRLTFLLELLTRLRRRVLEPLTTLLGADLGLGTARARLGLGRRVPFERLRLVQQLALAPLLAQRLEPRLPLLHLGARVERCRAAAAAAPHRLRSCNTPWMTITRGTAWQRSGCR